MRSSNKSRSRNKNNNRNRNVGNIVNRVFDSAGPEGKVRGTPQQIIDKYLGLTRDAQLSGDRVAAENFQQHAEHYARMLGEAQREQAERQAEQQRQRDQERQSAPQQQDEQPAVTDADAGSDVIVESGPQADGDSGLVDTPEARPNGENGSMVEDRPRKPRSRRPRQPAKSDVAVASDQPSPEPSGEQP